LILLGMLVCQQAHSAERRMTVAAADCQLSPETVLDAQGGSIRLAHSVLVADEMGATDFLQSEGLSDRVWAKKIFVLDSPEVTAAELFTFYSADHITVNGQQLAKSERLVSTGWWRVKGPPGILKKGENQVGMRG